MQQIQLSLPTGVIIQGRYIIEDVLGKGGFSAVYLVRDQHDGHLFALKELIDQDKQERARFAFEGEILERLDHQALPRIQRVFEDGDRAYMLMDYIEGPNLEVLRGQQPGKRFSLSQVLTIMAPIVEAVTYLHAQQPPLVHRDIKPANIIVPKTGAPAMLVDFGIVKEYHIDSTTTALRHCSPGYGAPEQYSGLGTDMRTDIYALGATCYALLTGIVPIDALRRATKLASKGSDPLLPVNELAPDVPLQVAEVIHRAMSIGNESRFSHVGEFWQALKKHATKEAASEPAIEQALLLASARSAVHGEDSGPTTPHKQKASLLTLPARKRRVVLLTALALLIVAAVGFSFRLYTLNDHRPGSTISASTLQHKASPTFAPGIYPNLARSYDGTIHNLLTNATMHLSFTRIQQNREMIKGYFRELQQADRTFTGVLDTSQHVFFTVAGSSQHVPLFFEGSVRPDGNLVGNYCSVDQVGQCVGDYGIWSVTPTA